MNEVLEHMARDRLVWLPEEGVGYYEVEGAPYDEAYFARYASMADTEVGRSLNSFRVDLLQHAHADEGAGRAILDVGIGDRTFIRAARRAGFQACGFDVNPAGVAWLQGNGLWGDLYRESGWPVLTFWDSLEHIREAPSALMQASEWAFVSIPIFRDCDHVLASRHYRKDEHYWYFTRDGFRRFAGKCGFTVVDILATETALGREDIETFVLMKDRAP